MTVVISKTTIIRITTKHNVAISNELSHKSSIFAMYEVAVSRCECNCNSSEKHYGTK